MVKIDLNKKELEHLENALVTVQVFFKQGKIVHGDKDMIDTLQKIREKLTQKLNDDKESNFLEALRTAYRKEIRASPVAPYVQVCKVRSWVCGDLGIDRDTFDLKLVSMASEDPYLIQLSAGTGKKNTGVFYGRGVCHFVNIK